jgi:hypothetical protein
MAIMKANQFPIAGVTRSYADFYLGFGLFVTVALLAECVVFWQLGQLAKANRLPLRPIMATFLFCYVGYAAIAFTYFFAAPGIFEVMTAACLGAAILKSTAGEVERSRSEVYAAKAI